MGLHTTFIEITSPQYWVCHTFGQFNWRSQLYRQTVLRFALSDFLHKCAPKELQDRWIKETSTDNSTYSAHGDSGHLQIPTKAEDFFILLAQYRILPVDIFPFCILFLLGKLPNFSFWWNHSIAPALDFHGYDASVFIFLTCYNLQVS